ncbi:glycosyltransferase [Paenibacillus alkaliterrae]|uniref:glycosyltransferase family 2 protein n=1 Tax=Paenibacillus alkaliterrae TaxID=320909 RepID=UPI001F1832A9|nr:glycosyltransferase [Paenibacillus alkaliterrae]MCF2937413.1 glycosyltransferase [Paenibacillus alkaliterrae]
MNMKVSVIIPVYNAEKYISECIDSLLAQTLQHCEFIFVNDGCSDRSRLIIEGYQNKDARIKLINQPNQGVSAARNNGIAAAVGEYVGFVDADDWVEPSMFETLYDAAAAEQCDIVFSNFESEQDGRRFVNQCPFPAGEVLDKYYISKEIFPIYVKGDQLNSVWNKLYKAALIRGHKVQFPDEIALGEDGLFNIKAISCSVHVKYIDFTGYHYREAPGSASRNIAKKDYFAGALDVYQMKLPPAFLSQLDEEKVLSLKSFRLIKSVISYIHLYYMPATGLSFRQKYRYVKKMLEHKAIHEAIPRYKEQINGELGRYEWLILLMMKSKSAMALYWLTAYSRTRNKQSIGG